MKIAIIGSRSFNDYELVLNYMKSHFDSGITSIISGGAKACADSLGKRFATEFNIDYVEFLADWKSYGKAAGMIRNKLIVESADVIIAFWDGLSKGTLNSINTAKKLKKAVHLVNINDKYLFN